MGTARSLISVSVGGQSLLLCSGVIMKGKYPATVLPVLGTDSYSARVGMKILISTLLQYICLFVGVCDGVADQLLSG